jgi:hypothetical protein
MVESISSVSSYSTTSSTSKSQSLSFEQEQTIQDVLSNYDASSLSSEDAQEIVSAFSQANIQPSEAMAESMQSEGFDAKEIAQLAGVEGNRPPPPPPPPSSSQDSDENDTVSTLLEELFNRDEDENSNDISFETLMDYTSKIANLNDSAKQTILDVLDKYGVDNTELSSEEASSVVKNVLSEILGDDNNYNHTSYYA